LLFILINYSKLTGVKAISVINYLDKGLKAGRKGQINVDEILNILGNEIIVLPLKDIYYKILILKTDMYSDETNFVIGLAQEGIGSVISINRFLKLDYQTQIECIKTETIHELGHVFGLIPDSRTIMVEESLGKHCKNHCTMRQGLNVPTDWIEISKDRLNYGTFCDICREDLRMFFTDK
jgi:predicted Zn-dependent protease